MDKRARIVDVIKKVSGKTQAPDAEESLFDSGFLDSNSLVDLVAGLEEEFAVRIPDSDLTPRKFDSVARIETYLQSRS